MALKEERSQLGQLAQKVEEQRVRLNEVGAELNQARLDLTAAHASETEAVEAARSATLAADEAWAEARANASQLEAAVGRANEAGAAAADAVAARVAAEDQLGTTRVLLAEATAAAEHLGVENRQLRETVAGFDARVAHVEEQLGAVVEAANAALTRVAQAAVEAIAPTAASLRAKVLAVAQAAPEDGDQTEFLVELQEQLNGASSESRATEEHGRKAAQERAAMVKRVAAEASAKLRQDVAAVMEALR
jgi:hypothetical protein